jgi:hypothetical protein
MTVPSAGSSSRLSRRSRARRAALALSAGALLLAGVSACGSSSDTAADPDTTPAAASSPQDTGSATAGSRIDATALPDEAAATASDDPGNGVAPASISIDSPQSGSTVSTTLTVSGTANSPEANVPWRIDSPTDGVLVSGFATADGWLDKAYPWSTSVDVSALQPGTYTFTARVDDDSKKEGTTPPSATITFVKK